MLEEAIQAIGDLAVAAKSPAVLNPADDPRKRLLVFNDGRTSVYDVPPAVHAERLATPRELAAFINQQVGPAGDSPEAVIYLNDGGLVVIYDRRDRRDRAYCALQPTDQWALLTELDQSPKRLGHREFYRLLRVDLDGCLPDDRLLTLIKQIKWQQNDSGSSAVTNASHTMGRELVAQVMGQDAIPEEVTLSVPVWNGVFHRETVRCALEVVPETKQFSISPFPNQLDDALANAREWAREDVAALLDPKVPIYLGSPDCP